MKLSSLKRSILYIYIYISSLIKHIQKSTNISTCVQHQTDAPGPLSQETIFLQLCFHSVQLRFSLSWEIFMSVWDISEGISSEKMSL